MKYFTVRVALSQGKKGQEIAALYVVVPLNFFNIRSTFTQIGINLRVV